MQRNALKNRKHRSGTITMELGLAAPLLMLMMAGAADFARIFYHSITVAHASGTGAFYGAQSTTKSASYSSIETAATNDAEDLEDVSVTATLYCDCPDGGGTAACLDGDCGAYGSGSSGFLVGGQRVAGSSILPTRRRPQSHRSPKGGQEIPKYPTRQSGRGQPVKGIRH